ncbi:hypothetical protein, partial [Gilvimarinus sp. 1_MG-2023]|uniref:hypothetical protein n=1 Tax=Gilvimarinus sp. 1_MG-2023 TaxID=3062638 RepID=UPI0026E28DAF
PKLYLLAELILEPGEERRVEFPDFKFSDRTVFFAYSANNTTFERAVCRLYCGDTNGNESNWGSVNDSRIPDVMHYRDT